jgi:hypothetical protein
MPPLELRTAPFGPVASGIAAVVTISRQLGDSMTFCSRHRDVKACVHVSRGIAVLMPGGFALEMPPDSSILLKPPRFDRPQSLSVLTMTS